MFFWFTSNVGGVLCISVSLFAAVFLIVWRGTKRLDCPLCHHPNPIHANFCAQCGRPLDE